MPATTQPVQQPHHAQPQPQPYPYPPGPEPQAQAQPRTRPPSAHRRALATWLAVYPAITVVLGGLGPHIGRLPLLVRTLVLTAIVVPAAVYVLVPALLRLDAVLGRAARRADVSPSGGPRPPRPGRARG
jgi:hypothetical protein